MLNLILIVIVELSPLFFKSIDFGVDILHIRLEHTHWLKLSEGSLLCKIVNIYMDFKG